MKKVIFLLCITTILNAKVITGMGYSSNEIEARNFALSDISNQISTEVLSEFNTISKSFNGELKSIKENIVKTKSELPIIGASFIYKRDQDIVEAVLDSQKVLPLYEENLKNLLNEINKQTDMISKEKDKTKLYDLYSNLQMSFEIFNKYKIVALLLESKNIPELNITSSEIVNQLSQLSKEVESIDLAAKLLAPIFNEKDIFIYPAKNGISAEITPFAKVFQQSISKYIKNAYSPQKAKYFLSGKYEILSDKIFLSYTLIDKNNNVLKQNSIVLLNKAYDGLRVKPITTSFQEEIHSDFLKTSDLKIDISFKDQGTKDVLLLEGDSVDLVVRSNRAIYFYLVGHILHEEKKSSYLVELQPDAFGKNKFVYRLGGSDVNIPFSLGEFEISGPFGFESLQMFASTKAIKDDIPSCTVDKNGLCIIGADPKKAIAKTRALIRVKKNKQKVLKAEALLEYTTMKK